MAIDPSRATFVSHEYRYETVTDNATKAVYPEANELELKTNLSAASAATLAAAYLADLKGAAQAFQIETQQIMALSDFNGGVPRYTMVSPTYQTDGRAFKVASAAIDYMKGVTTLKVRG